MCQVKRDFHEKSRAAFLFFLKLHHNKAMLEAEFRRALADRLVRAMREANVKSTTLAAATNVTVQAVGQWRKSGKIAVDRLPDIASILGKSIDWLLTGIDGVEEKQERYGLRTAPVILRPVAMDIVDLINELTPRQRALVYAIIVEMIPERITPDRSASEK